MDDLEQLLAFAEKALQESNYEASRKAFAKYLEVRPTDERALICAAEVSRQFNDTSHVCEIYAKAVGLEPNNLNLRAEWIETLFADQQTEVAVTSAQEASARHPDFLRFKLQIAQAEVINGNFDVARRIFWECHAEDPQHLAPLSQLSQNATAEDMDHLAPVLDALWQKRQTLSPGDQITLAYARARVTEKLKRYEEAWESYALGAATHRSISRYNELSTQKNLQMHQQLFDRQSPIHRITQNKSLGSNLIFIVSLPRAGSTLVEQILASHPMVDAIGERSFAFEAFNLWYDDPRLKPSNRFEEGAFEAARTQYMNSATETAFGKGPFIIDKSITNFLYVGFLHTLFPGARFVHVVRNPLDVAFSCFATPFFTGIEWSYELGETGRMIRRYQKLMRQWMKQWPDDILNASYEELIEDVETTTRRVLEFCNLEWDPACLDFHKTKRAVMTASVVQVRQPIYQTAKGRASHFEAHLGPLKLALGRAANPDWYLKP